MKIAEYVKLTEHGRAQEDHPFLASEIHELYFALIIRQKGRKASFKK